VLTVTGNFEFQLGFYTRDDDGRRKGFGDVVNGPMFEAGFLIDTGVQ